MNVRKYRIFDFTRKIHYSVLVSYLCFVFFFLEQKRGELHKMHCIIIIGQLLQRVCQPVVFFLQRSICFKKNSKNLIILLKLGRVNNYSTLLLFMRVTERVFKLPNTIYRISFTASGTVFIL